MKYACEMCGFTYDEDLGDPRRGIAPGTPFAQLPEDYECPSCGYTKEAFDPKPEPGQHTHMRIQTHIRTGVRR